DLMAASSAVESADAPPTAEATAAVKTAEASIPQVLSAWQSFIQQLAAANSQLQSAGATPLSLH
ncbi:MAG: hypothetical protein ABI383_05010, partial [Acidobacteriaceae bacterium]